MFLFVDLFTDFTKLPLNSCLQLKLISHLNFTACTFAVTDRQLYDLKPINRGSHDINLHKLRSFCTNLFQYKLTGFSWIPHFLCKCSWEWVINKFVHIISVLEMWSLRHAVCNAKLVALRLPWLFSNFSFVSSGKLNNQSQICLQWY